MKHFFAYFERWLAIPLPGKNEHCLQVDNYARLYINHQMIYKFKPDIVKHCVEYYSHPGTNVRKKYANLDMVDWVYYKCKNKKQAQFLIIQKKHVLFPIN